MNLKSLKLHFLGRESYVDYLWAKNVTGSGFFEHSGILLYQDSVLSIYATPEEIESIKKSAKNLIRDAVDIVSLDKKFDSTRASIKALSPLFTVKSVWRKSSAELYRLFIRLIDTLRDYINVYRLTEPHCVAHIEKLALNIIKSKTKRNQTEVLAEVLSKERSFNADYGFDDEELRIFHILDTMAKVRFETKKLVNPLSEFAEVALREVARRTELSVNQISNLDKKELERLLKGRHIPNLESINKRQHCFALGIQVNRGKITVRDLPDSQIKQIIAYDQGQAKVSTLKGDIGYPGSATGRARLVPTISEPEEYNKYLQTLKKSDILIASMIGPNLTLAFSKVAAVVTDEGGLMSHAALIAREKKVPCLIGTRLATRTFKDGERVFVDATNGIVKKMKL